MLDKYGSAGNGLASSLLVIMILILLIEKILLQYKRMSRDWKVGKNKKSCILPVKSEFTDFQSQ